MNSLPLFNASFNFFATFSCFQTPPLFKNNKNFHRPLYLQCNFPLLSEVAKQSCTKRCKTLAGFARANCNPIINHYDFIRTVHRYNVYPRLITLKLQETLLEQSDLIAAACNMLIIKTSRRICEIEQFIFMYVYVYVFLMNIGNKLLHISWRFDHCQSSVTTKTRGVRRIENITCI